MKLASLRRAIGVIAQDPFLFSTTVRDNIAFGLPELTDAQIERVARLAQAHEFVERLPQGYDTVIGERGITLSGGQRQRIAIARALAVDPRILILDDATASVDATTEAKIRTGLREVMSGRTTLIIAHRLSTIALADEIVVLDGGRIAARGTQEELLRTSPIYREIHEHGLLERQFADAVEARARRGGGRGAGESAAPTCQRRAERHADARQRGARRGPGLVVEHDASPARSPVAAHKAVPVPHLPLRLLPARCDCDSARASPPREVRARRRDRREHGDEPHRGRGAIRPPRTRELGHDICRDVHDRLGRRADPRGPPQAALRPPPAALARLLRAKSRRRADQPDDERRRGDRPARDGRRHDARAEHAPAQRDGVSPRRSSTCGSPSPC